MSAPPHENIVRNNKKIRFVSMGDHRAVYYGTIELQYGTKYLNTVYGVSRI
jgi:hypothetical protein